MSEDHAFHGSSNVRSARYDPESRELTINFQHGRSYPPVTGVSPEKWRQFKNSGSPGAFINQHFRKRP